MIVYNEVTMGPMPAYVEDCHFYCVCMCMCMCMYVMWRPWCPCRHTWALSLLLCVCMYVCVYVFMYICDFTLCVCVCMLACMIMYSVVNTGPIHACMHAHTGRAAA